MLGHVEAKLEEIEAKLGQGDARTSQDGSKLGQDGPRWAKMGPSWRQNGAKMDQKCEKWRCQNDVKKRVQKQACRLARVSASLCNIRGVGPLKPINPGVHRALMGHYTLHFVL